MGRNARLRPQPLINHEAAFSHGHCLLLAKAPPKDACSHSARQTASLRTHLNTNGGPGIKARPPHMVTITKRSKLRNSPVSPASSNTHTMSKTQALTSPIWELAVTRGSREENLRAAAAVMLHPRCNFSSSTHMISPLAFHISSDSLSPPASLISRHERAAAGQACRVPGQSTSTGSPTKPPVQRNQLMQPCGFCL